MSDASFVLDVVAQMTGGEQTIAQTETLSRTMIAAGVSAGTLHDAVAAASNALTASKAAASAANAALADGNTKYRELEQAANQAAKAQEKTARGSKGVVDVDAYRAAVAASTAANAALAAHADALAGLEASARDAAKSENALATSLGNVRKIAAATSTEVAKQAAAEKEAAAKVAAAVNAKAQAESRASAQSERSLKKLRSGFAGVGGPLGKLGAAGANAVDDFKDLEEVLGSSGAKMAFVAGAAASVVVALLVVAAAAVAATVAIAAWAIGLADSRRAAALNQQAVEALDPAIAALSGSYAAITAQTGQTTPQLNALAKALTAAKVSAEDMPEALRAAALAESALGQGGSAQFVDDIKKGKVAVGQLSREVQSKLGGIVAKQMQGLDAQTAKLKANIGQLFGGLNIEPVLAGLQKLVGLFDESTSAGAAIKFLFESVFQPLINQAENAATVIEAFALGFLIGLTKVYIAAQPAIKAISEFFGQNDPSLADTLAVVTKAGEYAAYIFVGFVVALAAIGAAIAVVVVPLIAMQVAVYAMVAALVAAVVYVDSAFISAFQGVWAYMSSLPAKMVQMGSDLIMGLVNGITGAAASVANAVSGAVDGAITAAKNKLGIHSPSKVFAEIGGYTAEGFADGVDAGAPSAQTALERLADPSTAAASSGGGGKASAGGGGAPMVDMKGATFVFQGVANAEQAESRFEEMFTRLLEGQALQAEGGAPA